MYNIILDWAASNLLSIFAIILSIFVWWQTQTREEQKQRIDILTRCVSSDSNIEYTALNEIFTVFYRSHDVVLAIQKFRELLNLRDTARPLSHTRDWGLGSRSQEAIDDAKEILIKTMCVATGIPYNVLLGSTGFTEKMLDRFIPSL